MSDLQLVMVLIFLIGSIVIIGLRDEEEPKNLCEDRFEIFKEILLERNFKQTPKKEGGRVVFEIEIGISGVKYQISISENGYQNLNLQKNNECIQVLFVETGTELRVLLKILGL